MVIRLLKFVTWLVSVLLVRPRDKRLNTLGAI